MDHPRGTPLNPDAIIPWLGKSFGGDAAKAIAGVAQDDCGVIRLGDTIVVVTADFLNASPIAEQTGVGNERTLGRLAVAATIADLVGTGAIPRAVLAAVTVPHGYPERLFKELMMGMRSESRKWGAPIIGGDTKLGRGRAVLTCGLGTVGSIEELFLSCNARPGDSIFASGYLGTCAAATLLAADPRSGRPVPAWVRAAITTPDLPIKKARSLAPLRVGRGGTDVSDGLGVDLRHLCTRSNVGALIDVDSIPVRRVVKTFARVLGVPPWTFAFASGGDFQFVVTVPKDVSQVAVGLGFTRIGRITPERRVVLRDAAGVTRPLAQTGHRDRKGVSFAEEIKRIVAEVQA